MEAFDPESVIDWERAGHSGSCGSNRYSRSGSERVGGISIPGCRCAGEALVVGIGGLSEGSVFGEGAAEFEGGGRESEAVAGGVGGTSNTRPR